MGKDDEITIHRNYFITDKDFVYINDVSTDIMRTFRKMGWVPPSELKKQRLEEEQNKSKKK